MCLFRLLHWIYLDLILRLFKYFFPSFFSNLVFKRILIMFKIVKINIIFRLYDFSLWILLIFLLLWFWNFILLLIWIRNFLLAIMFLIQTLILDLLLVLLLVIWFLLLFNLYWLFRLILFLSLNFHSILFFRLL